VCRAWAGADLIRFIDVKVARDGKNRQPEGGLEHQHQNPELGVAEHVNHLFSYFWTGKCTALSSVWRVRSAAKESISPSFAITLGSAPETGTEIGVRTQANHDLWMEHVKAV
jgi:hypothetical protein